MKLLFLGLLALSVSCLEAAEGSDPVEQVKKYCAELRETGEGDEPDLSSVQEPKVLEACAVAYANELGGMAEHQSRVFRLSIQLIGRSNSAAARAARAAGKKPPFSRVKSTRLLHALAVAMTEAEYPGEIARHVFKWYDQSELDQHRDKFELAANRSTTDTTLQLYAKLSTATLPGLNAIVERSSNPRVTEHGTAVARARLGDTKAIALVLEKVPAIKTRFALVKALLELRYIGGNEVIRFLHNELRSKDFVASNSAHSPLQSKQLLYASALRRIVNGSGQRGYPKIGEIRELERRVADSYGLTMPEGELNQVKVPGLAEARAIANRIQAEIRSECERHDNEER